MVVAALVLAASLPRAAAAQSSALAQLRQMAPEDSAVVLPAPAAAPTGAWASVVAPPDRYAQASRLGRPATVVDLDEQLNVLWRSATTFPAGDRTVHVFGLKAENDDSRSGWFVGLYVDGAPGPVFLNGAAMAHCIICSGGYGNAVLNGIPFVFHIEGIGIFHHSPKDIKLVVQAQGFRRAFSLYQITKGVYDVGYPVRVGSTVYHLIYTPDFDSDGNGHFSHYTGDRSISLMFQDGSDFSGLHRYERQIPSDGRVLITTPLRVGSTGDSYQPGDVTLGLRIDGRNLEIYYPINPSVPTTYAP